MLITDSKYTYNKNLSRFSKRLANVFVKVKRPIDDGDFIEDFAWRRTHKPPKLNKQVRKAVVAAINEHWSSLNVKEEDLTVVYNRYTGCPMCPCSPGYIVRTKVEGQEVHGCIDVWMEEK